MSTTGQTTERQNPVRPSSHELVWMILGADPRISSGPAAMRAAQTGRTHDRTQPRRTIRHFPLARTGPSTHGRAKPGHDELLWSCGYGGLVGALVPRRRSVAPLLGFRHSGANLKDGGAPHEDI